MQIAHTNEYMSSLILTPEELRSPVINFFKAFFEYHAATDDRSQCSLSTRIDHAKEPLKFAAKHELGYDFSGDVLGLAWDAYLHVADREPSEETFEQGFVYFLELLEAAHENALRMIKRRNDLEEHMRRCPASIVGGAIVSLLRSYDMDANTDVPPMLMPSRVKAGYIASTIRDYLETVIEPSES